MPEGMKENDKFPEPIITPATKADEGHDEDISREAILEQNIVPQEIYEKLEMYTRQLFERGTQMAAKQGLILVDTKYEFGLLNGEIILIDEIHTPDSSRYFYADGYTQRQIDNVPQKQLSKEFVRQWLIENGFQGLEGQEMPVMPDDFVKVVSDRYIELYEKITGNAFQRAETKDIPKRITQNLEQYLANS
jgi:phosphoribosylaminoimidazole-succinocarboxamide synthase